MRKNAEFLECKAFFKWASYHPVCAEYLIKHVNEGKRSAILGRLLKLIGLRPGLPDYQLPIANKNWKGLWLEMKTKEHDARDNRSNQDEWLARLRKINHYACYAYGWEHAAKIVTDYLADRI